jgi:uncharacterized membrane-anchored protein
MHRASPYRWIGLRAVPLIALAIASFTVQVCAQEAEDTQELEQFDASKLTPEQKRFFELYSSIKWQEGPGTANIGSFGQIELPQGYRFTDQEGARIWAEVTGNIPDENELGVLKPAESDDWFVVFTYDDIGHVKDDERDSLDADAILKSIQQGTEAGNEVRRERGMRELAVTGWARPPAYDPKTNNLCWATKLVLKEDPQAENVNYQTRLLGRTGVMNVTLVCDTDKLDSTVPVLENMLGHYEFKDGQKYAEWTEGDKLATVGLTGLIAGGAAVVAVKSGLFAKLLGALAKAGKLIVVVIIGIGAGLARLFRRSTPQTEEA